MKSGLIRPARLEKDVPGIARLVSACEPDHPVSEGRVRTRFQPQAPGRTRLNLVSVGENGAVKGIANLIQAAEAPARHYTVWVGVDPSHRRQGIGSALGLAGWAPFFNV